MSESRSALGYQAKLARFQERQWRKSQALSNRKMDLMQCNRVTLVGRILKLETQAGLHRGKLGSQAARISKLKDTVKAQEAEIRYLRQQIAVLRRVA